ncbi:hypothetical protein E3203_04050 [Oecophyllibacter saccharovorans]|nr:hypothetical protein E3203_04050 [Oecophyllibacter saccharovorans]
MAMMTRTDPSSCLNRLLISELTSRVEPAISDFARKIADSFSVQPLAILFYGSQSRALQTDGLLDFYVIFAQAEDLPGNREVQAANRILPPNVIYRESQTERGKLRAKIALLTLAQFQQRATFQALDTTIWARFCQPVRMVWVQGPRAADVLLGVVHDCVVTAAEWAALLGPSQGTAVEFWHHLFKRTYAAELRVEKQNRSTKLLQGREGRYKALLEAGWAEAGIPYRTLEGTPRLSPQLPAGLKEKAVRRWEKISRYGKGLNFLRLLKAAFTFEGGVDYLLWKIERHTGQAITVSAFERKHPLLALPMLLWRFRKLRHSAG